MTPLPLLLLTVQKNSLKKNKSFSVEMALLRQRPSETSSEPKLKSLNERFKQKYPKEKFTGAVAIGYDAMMLTAQALKKVGKSPKQQHLVAALRAINSFQGTTGLINFNGKNDPFKSFYIWTYKNGKVYKIKEVK